MNIYIDESGSINNKQQAPFVIALINVKETVKLKKAYKRFISKNLDVLKKAKDNKMFKEGNFTELKGSSLTYDMKIDFVNFITKNSYFDIYFIEIDNAKLSDVFSSNTAKVFNYTLKNALQYFITNKLLVKEDINLHIDERNEKTGLKNHLEEYINTEFMLENITDKKTNVKYYDSQNCINIQLADVFANIYFSKYYNKDYDIIINRLTDESIIKFIYKFPL